jgi:hypothetical protein
MEGSVLCKACIIVGQDGKTPRAGFEPLISVCKKKEKAVTLHAMEARGGRGGIAPTLT